MEQVLKYYPLIALSAIGVLIIIKIKLFRYLMNGVHFNLLYYSKKTVELRKQKLIRKQNILTGIILALLISIFMVRFSNLTAFINFSHLTSNQAGKSFFEKCAGVAIKVNIANT
ncbi:MAG: hypothetical protein ACR2KZ_17050 [Segetibacter sp.]